MLASLPFGFSSFQTSVLQARVVDIIPSLSRHPRSAVPCEWGARPWAGESGNHFTNPVACGISDIGAGQTVPCSYPLSPVISPRTRPRSLRVQTPVLGAPACPQHLSFSVLQDPLVPYSLQTLSCSFMCSLLPICGDQGLPASQGHTQPDLQ